MNGVSRPDLSDPLTGAARGGFLTGRQGSPCTRTGSDLTVRASDPKPADRTRGRPTLDYAAAEGDDQPIRS